MTDWVGFTDEDLKKLKGGTLNENETSRHGHHAQRGRAGTRGRGRSSGNRRTTPSRETPPPSEPATHAQLLSPPRQPVTPAKKPPADHNQPNGSHTVKRRDTGPGEGQFINKDQMTGSKEDKPEPTELVSADRQETKNQEEDVKLKEIDEKEALSREMSQLEKFQQQQKLIEEQNKKKREMLALAIQKRQKAAKQESVKLQHVQRELNKLDVILTGDVNIIRDRIEEASRDFLEAQKRYERAENEFIAAKMALHNKSELKGQLTEHLYTIIHQNELRKADRLAELMKELGLEGMFDEVPGALSTSLLLPQFPLISSISPVINAQPKPRTEYPETLTSSLIKTEEPKSKDESQGNDQQTEQTDKTNDIKSKSDKEIPPMKEGEGATEQAKEQVPIQEVGSDQAKEAAVTENNNLDKTEVEALTAVEQKEEIPSQG